VGIGHDYDRVIESDIPQACLLYQIRFVGSAELTKRWAKEEKRCLERERKLVKKHDRLEHKKEKKLLKFGRRADKRRRKSEAKQTKLLSKQVRKEEKRMRKEFASQTKEDCYSS
ncbi:hypothetical protein ADUPG1_005534, partial [Aduncisulcus paluster]